MRIFCLIQIIGLPCNYASIGTYLQPSLWPCPDDSNSDRPVWNDQSLHLSNRMSCPRPSALCPCIRVGTRVSIQRWWSVMCLGFVNFPLVLPHQLSHSCSFVWLWLLCRFLAAGLPYQQARDIRIGMAGELFFYICAFACAISSLLFC